MKKEFLSVLAQLEREKGIDKSILIEAVKEQQIMIGELNSEKEKRANENLELKNELNELRSAVEELRGIVLEKENNKE